MIDTSSTHQASIQPRRIRPRELARALAADPYKVVAHLFGAGVGTIVGNEWIIGDITGRAGGAKAKQAKVKNLGLGSLRVNISGRNAGAWMDFANRDHRGDLLNLIQIKLGCSFEEARRIGEMLLNLPSPEWPAQGGRRTGQPVQPKDDGAKMRWATRVWEHTIPVASSRIARAYFAARHLPLPNRDCTRFAPSCWDVETGLKFPAIVSRITNPAGKFMGVHIIYLEADGSWKNQSLVDPKKLIGDQVGGAILWHVGETDTVIIAEGLEDAATVSDGNRKHTILIAPTGAALASCLPGPRFKHVFIAGQNCPANVEMRSRLAVKLGDRFAGTILPKSKDWNDDRAEFGAYHIRLLAKGFDMKGYAYLETQRRAVIAA